MTKTRQDRHVKVRATITHLHKHQCKTNFDENESCCFEMNKIMRHDSLSHLDME